MISRQLPGQPLPSPGFHDIVRSVSWKAVTVTIQGPVMMSTILMSWPGYIMTLEDSLSGPRHTLKYVKLLLIGFIWWKAGKCGAFHFIIFISATAALTLPAVNMTQGADSRGDGLAAGGPTLLCRVERWAHCWHLIGHFIRPPSAFYSAAVPPHEHATFDIIDSYFSISLKLIVWYKGTNIWIYYIRHYYFDWF